MTKRKFTPKHRVQRKQLLELLQGAGINEVEGNSMVSPLIEKRLIFAILFILPL